MKKLLSNKNWNGLQEVAVGLAVAGILTLWAYTAMAQGTAVPNVTTNIVGQLTLTNCSTTHIPLIGFQVTPTTNAQSQFNPKLPTWRAEFLAIRIDHTLVGQTNGVIMSGQTFTNDGTPVATRAALTSVVYSNDSAGYSLYTNSNAIVLNYLDSGFGMAPQPSSTTLISSNNSPWIVLTAGGYEDFSILHFAAQTNGAAPTVISYFGRLRQWTQ